VLGVFALPARDRRLRPLPAAPDDASRPRFSARMLITLGSSVAGLGIASYLTLAHYTSVVSLVCPNSGPISCDAVTTSSESYLFGIPVAVLGLVYFVVVLVFALPPVWRARHPYVAPARLALAVGGIGFVCYLLYAELYEVGKLCLWCTGVHVLTLVIFIAVVTGWDETVAHSRESDAAT
jgi:uncharacterized membrane protein